MWEVEMSDKTSDARRSSTSSETEGLAKSGGEGVGQRFAPTHNPRSDKAVSEIVDFLSSITPEELKELSDELEKDSATGKIEKRKPVARNFRMDIDNERYFISSMMKAAREISGCRFTDPLIVELEKFLKSHFNRARAAETPSVPTRKYQPRKDEIIPFLREVWGEWLADDKLTKQVLKDHDTPAYNALSNWQRNHPLPEDMRIKTLSDLNDEFLEWGYYKRDEVHRVASALARRGLDA